MGFTSSGGPKALGVFNTTPSTASDLNELLATIAAVGNYRAPITEAERDALTGDQLYEGALVFNTTAGTIEVYDGSGWAIVWMGRTSFTPSFTGLTAGSGATVTGTVQVSGGWAFVEVEVTLGSGSSVGDVTLAWPAGADGSGVGDIFPIGDVAFLDTSAGGAGRYRGTVYKTSGGARLLTLGTLGLTGVLSSSSPFTWASTDKILISLRYPIV
jgi:hypothetical protein